MPFLLPLPIRSAGTVEVGCFGSHLHRLAHAHGVSAGRLLEDTFNWFGIRNPYSRESLPAFKSNGGLATYARPNNTTRMILEVFNAATGLPELRSTSFLALDGVLQRAANTFSTHFRWCPTCFDDFRIAGDPGYFKLYWLLKEIKHCQTHGTELTQQCPHCGKTQGGMAHKRECRLCQSCGKELGYTVTDPTPLRSWQSEGADILDLVSVIANEPTLQFPDDGVTRIVSHLFDKAWASESELLLWKTIPQHECISLANNETLISLLIARRVAHYLGMALPDLLAGNIEAASHVLEPEWYKTLPKSIQPKTRHRSRDRERILQAVVNTINQFGKANPPPLITVADRVGVSTGYLNHHFPVLSKNIIQAHQDWSIEEMRKKHQLARLETFRYFKEAKSLAKYCSRKDALKTIREKTGLPKNLLREEIRSVYSVLF